MIISSENNCHFIFPFGQNVNKCLPVVIRQINLASESVGFYVLIYIVAYLTLLKIFDYGLNQVIKGQKFTASPEVLPA